MFDKFGEFDSAAELNRAAAAQLAERDTEAILLLAKENGIDKEDAEDYIDGLTSEFVTPTMAALGKLDIECQEYEINGVMEDWEGLLRSLVMTDEKMCLAVRRKGKNLNECVGKLIAFSFENMVQISNKITKVTKVNHNGKLEPVRTPLYLGIPNKAQARKIITDYYLGGGQ